MATEYEELKLTVGIDDNATDALKAINVKIAQLGGATQQAINEQIASQMKQTTAHLLNFDKEAGSLTGAISESMGAAATIAKTFAFAGLAVVGTAGIAGLAVRGIKEYSDSLAKLNQFSRETGFTVAAIKRMEEAFAKQGFSNQQSEAILKNIRQSMVDVLDPRGSMVSTLREHARRTPETVIAMEKYIAGLREAAKKGDLIAFFKMQTDAVQQMQKVLEASKVPPQVAANWTEQFAAVQNLGSEIMRNWQDIENVTKEDVDYYKTIADQAEKLFVATNRMSVAATKFQEAIFAIPLGPNSWIVSGAVWVADTMEEIADRAARLRDAAWGDTPAQKAMKERLRKKLEESRQKEKGGGIPSLRDLFKGSGKGATPQRFSGNAGPLPWTTNPASDAKFDMSGILTPQNAAIGAKSIDDRRINIATQQVQEQDQRQLLINELKRLSETLSPVTGAHGFTGGVAGAGEGGLSALKARMGVGGGMGALPGMGPGGRGPRSPGSGGPVGDTPPATSVSGVKAPTSPEEAAETVEEAKQKGYIQDEEGGGGTTGGLTKAGTISAGTDAAIVAAAEKHGLDPNYMRSIADIESSGDPGSNRNKRTQYKGLYQLNQEEFNKHGGGDLYSAKDNANAAAKMFAAQKAWFKGKYGRDPTPGELYLIHQQGPGFFVNGKLTNAAGNTPPGVPVPTSTTEMLKVWEDRVARGTKRAMSQHGVDPNDKTAVTPGAAKGKLKDFTLDDVKRSVNRGDVQSGTAAGALNDALQLSGLSENDAAGRAKIAQYLKSGGRGMDPATTAWCAAMVGAALQRAGIKNSGSDVANSYLRWGQGVNPANVQPGDVVVQPKGRGVDQTGGHVGMATGEVKKDKDGNITHIEMYAGNTSNRALKRWYPVNEVRIRRESDEARQKREANQPRQPQNPLATITEIEKRAKERYDAAAARNKNATAVPEGGIEGARKLLDKSMGNETKIKSTGKVTARVKSDDDTEVKIEAKGVFKGKKNVERVKEAGSSGESEAAAA